MNSPQNSARLSPLSLFGNGLLLLLALFSTLLFVVRAYGIPADPPPLLAVAAVSALLALVLFSLPRYRGLILLLLCAALAVAVWQNWSSLRDGALLTYSAAADVFTRAVGFPGPFTPPVSLPPEAARTSITLCLSLFTVLESWALGWAVVRRHAFFPTFLLTFPLLLPAFLAELSPSWPCLIAVASCWLALLFTGLSKKRAPLPAARLTLLALPVSAMLLSGLLLLSPPEHYVQPDWALRAQLLARDLHARLTSSISGGLPVSISQTDARVDLASAGPRHYTGRSVFTLTSELPGTLYLRGTSSATYTGHSWEPLDEEALSSLDALAAGSPLVSSSALLPAAANFSSTRYTVTLTPEDTPTYLVYTPYQPAETGQTVFTDDAYFRSEAPLSEYSISFFSQSEVPTPQPHPASAEEERYRQFVYQHYLSVPPELAPVLQRWTAAAEQEALRAGGPVRPSGGEEYLYRTALAQWYAGLLERTTEYDLETPYTPEDSDFVSHFLLTSRRGYCMHYASAAALLLRSEGIPARYVSGYLAQVPLSGSTTVPDSAAHAWVEIYLDGYGWYPVEVTPAAEETPTEETPAEQPLPQQPEETPPSEITSPEPEQQPEASAPAAEQPSEHTAPSYLLLLLIPPLLLLLYRISLHLRWIALRRECDSNRAARLLYGWFQRLTRFGGRTDERVLQLVRKARFSQHTLTPSERDELFSLLLLEIDRCARAQPLWRRPLFAYLFRFPSGHKNAPRSS